MYATLHNHLTGSTEIIQSNILIFKSFTILEPLPVIDLHFNIKFNFH